MSRLFCFGLGFSAQALAERLAAQGWEIAGTARDLGKIGHLAERGYEMVQYSGEEGNSALPKALQGTTHLLHSIPPGPDGDPGLHGGDLPERRGEHRLAVHVVSRRAEARQACVGSQQPP